MAFWVPPSSIGLSSRSAQTIEMRHLDVQVISHAHTLPATCVYLSACADEEPNSTTAFSLLSRKRTQAGTQKA